MDPSQVALVPVTYIEDRDRGALVRLPNGSKTTVQHEALSALPAWGNFTRAATGTGGSVMCTYCREECTWSTTFVGWHDGVEALTRHCTEAHAG